MTGIQFADDSQQQQSQQTPRRHAEFSDDTKTNANAPEHSIYNLKPLGRSRTSQSAHTTASDDGIVNIRSRGSRTFTGRRFSVSKDLEEDDEDPGLGRADDYKHKQVRLVVPCLSREPGTDTKYLRLSKDDTSSGLPISPSVSSTATSAPVPSMCSRRLSALRRPSLICSVSCR